MGRKRNPWVRLYTKILQCADYMEAPLATRVAWIAIICHASDMNQGGRLVSGTKPLNAERLAKLAGITKRQATDALAYLVECGMLVYNDEVYAVANWEEYQQPSDNSSLRSAVSRANSGIATVQEEEKKEKQIDPEAHIAANLLRDLVAANLKKVGYKPRALNAVLWAEDIEKIHRIDGVPYNTIMEVIRWCQNDSFWWKNIMSGDKLRKQMPKLLAQMRPIHQTPPAEIPRFS